MRLGENIYNDPFNVLSQGSDLSNELYVLIPAELSPSGADIYVKEDIFDHLSDSDWHAVMSVLEPEPGLGVLPAVIGAVAKIIPNIISSGYQATKGSITGFLHPKGTAATGKPGFFASIFGSKETREAKRLARQERRAARQGIGVTTKTDENILPANVQGGLMAWYNRPMTWVYIGGGALILVGGIYLMTKKKH